MAKATAEPLDRGGVTPRQELIQIQRTIVERLRAEIYSILEPPPLDLVRYEEEYRRSLPPQYRRLLRDETFFARLAKKRIVFQGDFHTLKECQTAGLRLLTELHERHPAVVLCIEVVAQAAQLALDGYMAGELDEGEFLAAIDYDECWGFPWRHYRPLFEFAREHEIQVYGINTPPRNGDSASVAQRDGRAAEAITRAVEAHPDALIHVIMGDFHVAPNHLPKAVEERLRAENASAPWAIVHQNVDSYYWQVAESGKEFRAHVLELRRDEFCILNSTPLAKYQSYLHWQLGQDELDDRRGFLEGWNSPATVADQVHELVETIAGFLGVDAGQFDDFTLYTSGDLNFLDDLQRQQDFSAAEIREIKRQVLNDESYFIGRGNIIYLSSLSVDHAAEEVAHYINSKLSGFDPEALPARVDFYMRCIREALGFFGSKIVNPLRHHHNEDDFVELLRQWRAEPERADLQALQPLARFVVQHIEVEKKWAGDRVRPRLRAIYNQDIDLHLGITHSLGYILGERIYQGVARGKIERGLVRDLFCRPLAGDEAERTYFDLAARL